MATDRTEGRGAFFSRCPAPRPAETLRKALHVQLRAEDGPIIDFVVGQLDEDGRLSCTVEEVVDYLHVEPEHVSRVIQRLRTVGPPGIGAHDLRECLLLQLDYFERNVGEQPLLRQIIRDYLPELGLHQDASIATALGTSPEAVANARAFIRRHMTPFPGRRGDRLSGGSGESDRVRPSCDHSRIRSMVQEAMWDILGEETWPVSDRELARVLGEQNIKVPRRTVARYRTQMGIPPAHRRRWGGSASVDPEWPAGDAEARAWALLYDVLEERERVQLAKRGYLQINSPTRPVRSYRIPADGGRVVLYERGRAVCELCVGPVEPLPAGDVLLLHKLMIEADERTYLARANLLPRSRR